MKMIKHCFKLSLMFSFPNKSGRLLSVTIPGKYLEIDFLNKKDRDGKSTLFCRTSRISSIVLTQREQREIIEDFLNQDTDKLIGIFKDVFGADKVDETYTRKILEEKRDQLLTVNTTARLLIKRFPTPLCDGCEENTDDEPNPPPPEVEPEPDIPEIDEPDEDEGVASDQVLDDEKCYIGKITVTYKDTTDNNKETTKKFVIKTKGESNLDLNNIDNTTLAQILDADNPEIAAGFNNGDLQVVKVVPTLDGDKNFWIETECPPEKNPADPNMPTLDGVLDGNSDEPNNDEPPPAPPQPEPPQPQEIMEFVFESEDCDKLRIDITLPMVSLNKFWPAIVLTQIKPTLENFANPKNWVASIVSKKTSGLICSKQRLQNPDSESELSRRSANGIIAFKVPEGLYYVGCRLKVKLNLIFRFNLKVNVSCKDKEFIGTEFSFGFSLPTTIFVVNQVQSYLYDIGGGWSAWRRPTNEEQQTLDQEDIEFRKQNPYNKALRDMGFQPDSIESNLLELDDNNKIKVNTKELRAKLKKHLEQQFEQVLKLANEENECCCIQNIVEMKITGMFYDTKELQILTIDDKNLY